MRVMDGEDRTMEERKREQARLQKEWIEEQKREREMQRDFEKEEAR